MSEILVTGGSGFVASHTIIRLLKAGHNVRTTVRSESRRAVIFDMLRSADCAGADRLSCSVADLENDAGWTDAIRGCDYVLHVASPLPMGEPKDEDDLIRPARDGTLRILKIARQENVKRVVLTSSFAAIGFGHDDRARPFDESDWTNLKGAVRIPAYIKSKCLAEKAAWDFASQNDGFELAVINPVGILGPALGSDFASSVSIIKMMLDGKMPAVPRVYFAVVDVRDVADLHIKAMTHPAAVGQRFIAAAGEPLSLADIGKLLKTKFPEGSSRVPTKEFPDWFVKGLAPFNAQLRSIAPNLGKVRPLDNSKAQRVFDWNPISTEESILATARSLTALRQEGKPLDFN